MSVEITYFSDVLCVWAYASQARIDAVKETFGDAVRIEHRFCSVFGDTAGKITSTWKDRGGFAGFNSHLREVAVGFPHDNPMFASAGMDASSSGEYPNASATALTPA